MATVIVGSLFLGLVVASVLVWALCLRLGLRWAKVPDVTLRRVALATLLVAVAHAAFLIGSYLIRPGIPRQTWLIDLLEFVGPIVIGCIIIARIFRTTSLRAFQAWLPTFLGQLVLLALLALVFIPFLAEAFVANGNSMAPTLLGEHWEGTCADCGGPAYCTPVALHGLAHGGSFPGKGPRMICRDHFHITNWTGAAGQTAEQDRFVVVKFLRPRRWDIILFRNPEDPSMLSVQRLVGMPGEEIVIRDGHVWADGEQLAPPESIGGIRYTTELDGPPGMLLWGSREQPARLADDEYFVLGDFTTNSRDSRVWSQGAPGHSPYAVPESHLYGVVTHCYWPPERWRTFR